MTEPDPHAPTSAGPTPDSGAVSASDAGAAPAAEPARAAEPAPEPTPVVPPSQASYATPAGTPWTPPDTEERPEILVGAAFAGGLLGALILKRLTGGGR